MGSFNTSCMVSQQTIVPGAPAVILPISQQATYRPVELLKNGKEISKYGFSNTNCYPTAFWGYAGPIIRGEYEDYGRFKIFDTHENQSNLVIFFNNLLENAFVTKKGENEYHDHAFDINAIYDNKKDYSFDELMNIWENIWDVSQKNRLFISKHQGNASNLQFSVIHQTAAHYLIDYVSKLKTYTGQSYTQKLYFTEYIQNYFKKTMDVIGKTIEKKHNDLMFFAIQISSLSNYHLGEQEGCYLSSYYENCQEVIKIIKEADITSEKLPSETLDLLFELFKEQIQHRYLHVGLDIFNIKLSPMVYASQDYDNSMGKNFTRMIKAVSAQVNKQIKEND